MLLWIFLGACVVLSAIAFHLGAKYGFDFMDAFGPALATFFVSIIVFGMALIIVVGSNSHTIKYRDTEVYEWELMALGNNTQTEGRSYFLGGGYIGEKKVINFITKDHKDRGSIRVEQLDAHTVKIFEGSEKPHLIRTTTVSSMEWAVPWDLDSVRHFDFYIPAGSVLESYSVDINK